MQRPCQDHYPASSPCSHNHTINSVALDYPSIKQATHHHSKHLGPNGLVQCTAKLELSAVVDLVSIIIGCHKVFAHYKPSLPRSNVDDCRAISDHDTSPARL